MFSRLCVGCLGYIPAFPGAGNCQWSTGAGSDPQGNSPGYLTCTTAGATITATCQCASKCPPLASLSFQSSGTTVGNSDQGTASTSISGDTVMICMSTSSSTIGPSLCLNGGVQEVSESVDSTTYNTQSLAVGSYYFIACDQSFWQEFPFMTDPCTAVYGPVTVSPAYTSSTTTYTSLTTTIGYWTGAVTGCQTSSTYDHCSSEGPSSFSEPVDSDATITCTCNSGYPYCDWVISAGGAGCNIGNSANCQTLVQCTGTGDSVNLRCGCYS